MISRRSLVASAVACAAGASTPIAFAQSSGRMVVGFPACGATDIAARLLAEKLRGRYEPAMIVDNKPGAAARIAVEFIKNAPADGSTALFSPDFPLTVYPHSYKKLNYDPLADFTPAGQCGISAIAMSVGKLVPESVKTMSDFIAWCKANPKLASFASTGAGATPHFVGVMFAKASGLDLTHVPYKGGAPAMQDLVGGQIAISFNPVSEVLPYASTGRIRVIATSGASRSRFLPDVPNFVEAGLPAVQAETRLGVYVSSKTPAAIVARLGTAIGEVMRLPEVVEAFEKMGV